MTRTNTFGHACQQCGAVVGGTHLADCPLVSTKRDAGFFSVGESVRAPTVLEDAIDYVRAHQKEALTIRLSKPTIAKLRKLASRENASINALVSAIVDSHVSRG